MKGWWGSKSWYILNVNERPETFDIFLTLHSSTLTSPNLKYIDTEHATFHSFNSFSCVVDTKREREIRRERERMKRLNHTLLSSFSHDTSYGRDWNLGSSFTSLFLSSFLSFLQSFFPSIFLSVSWLTWINLFNEEGIKGIKDIKERKISSKQRKEGLEEETSNLSFLIEFLSRTNFYHYFSLPSLFNLFGF